VTESASGFGFASESLDEFVVIGILGMDDFDGDDAFGADVRGAIDGSHPALTQHLFDLIFIVE